MIGALVMLTVVIYVIANSIGGSIKTAEAVQPVSKMSLAGTAMASMIASAQAADGAGTYTSACAACHATGAAGAPKLGDKADWAPRIKAGNATLYSHAIKGYQGKKGFMPAKGGQTQLSDAVVKAAVDHMVSKSK
ncbi:MAG: cytochrome c5 family protein [Proteobacteria bacterium]|nr:cytochrome c5 family protein [Pseudomonadota bacterium]